MDASALSIRTPYGVITGKAWEGHGRPVVALHGLMDSSAGWARYAQETHRPVIALDLPGFGHSDNVQEPTVQAYCQMLKAAIAVFDAQPILIGHSMGGLLASYLAKDIDAPCLLLVAPAGFGRILLAELVGTTPIKFAVKNAVPWALLNPLMTEAAYRLAVSGGHGMPHAMRWNLMHESFRMQRGAYMAIQMLGQFSHGLKTHATAPPQLTVPTSAIWGSRDLLVPPSHSQALKRFVPSARIEIWDKVAHHPHVECPTRLHRWIEYRATGARAEVRRRRHALRRTTSGHIEPDDMPRI